MRSGTRLAQGKHEVGMRLPRSLNDVGMRLT